MQRNTDTFLSWGFNDEDVAHLIHAAPGILSLSTNRLHQTFAFLDNVGVKKENIPETLLRCPRFVKMNSNNNLLLKKNLLLRHYTKAEVAAILRHTPQILTCSHDQLSSRLRALEQSGMLHAVMNRVAMNQDGQKDDKGRRRQ
ncbi:MTERFD1 [Symbiodinium pilosum]|uniref:mTERFD1 protein n=1 Tax=Symbiodinium pilosum TaxID=2952 RepID=A0A812Y2K7_SYMPI|nr:MTERFD1 [Symbiodinium pilosum]